MGKLPKTFTTLLFICLAFTAFCQEAKAGEDDEFNIFLLAIVGIGICTMFGAAIVCALFAALVLLAGMALVSASIVSASVLIGLYKKSFSAGFRSLLLMGSSIGGAIIGSLGLLLVSNLFYLHISTSTCLITGSISGLIGGLIIGNLLSKFIRFFFGKFRPISSS